MPSRISTSTSILLAKRASSPPHTTSHPQGIAITKHWFLKPIRRNSGQPHCIRYFPNTSLLVLQATKNKSKIYVIAAKKTIRPSRVPCLHAADGLLLLLRLRLNADFLSQTWGCDVSYPINTYQNHTPYALTILS